VADRQHQHWKKIATLKPNVCPAKGASYDCPRNGCVCFSNLEEGYRWELVMILVYWMNEMTEEVNMAHGSLSLAVLYFLTDDRSLGAATPHS
jgi:hypothetical protein